VAGRRKYMDSGMGISWSICILSKLGTRRAVVTLTDDWSRRGLEKHGVCSGTAIAAGQGSGLQLWKAMERISQVL
jgi:hypothetical protein